MRLFFALSLSLLFGAAYGQTFTAVNCNESGAGSVSDAANQAAAVTTSNATVLVIIPSCPAGVAWTGAIASIFPTNIISATIQGQTTIATMDANGNPATWNDNTVIIDHAGLTSNVWFLGTLSTSPTSVLRLSGITWLEDSGSTVNNNCAIGFGAGNKTSYVLRMDHMHFSDAGFTAGNSGCYAIVDGIAGVMDHSQEDLSPSSGTGIKNGIRVNGGGLFNDSSSQGNASWSNPTGLGTWNEMYFENDTFNGGISNDCNGGGRQGFRHNSYNNSSVQTHEMEQDTRGCRATEVYQNAFVGVNGDTINSFTAVGYRMGTGVIWGNTSSFMENLISSGNDRTNGGHPQTATPGGWGYCGTLGTPPAVGPSNWDGNSIGVTGYPCVDYIGRGTSDVLNGSFPNKCDVTTGCSTFNGTWPHNYLEPIYEWLDQYQVGATWQFNLFSNGDGNTATINRDYYTYTLAWNGSAFTGTAFNGTVGTGSGLLASRPGTCTAGPGGTYGASAVGSNGVAYWATDTNTLYTCTSTNTWTAYYTPYVYPHPLVSNTPVVTISPSSLPGGTVSVSYSQTLTASGGTAPYTWSLGSGTLPAGTSINSSTGVISGTPTTPTTYSFSIHVHDSTGGTPLTADQSYGVTIAPSGTPSISAPANGIILGSATFQKQMLPQAIGNWQGLYGADGYDFAASISKIPSYATVTPANFQLYTWTNLSADPRALSLPLGGRIAACWYNSAPWTLDVNFVDGKTHMLTLYASDFDSYGGTPRAETFTLTDATSGKVLDTRSIAGFTNGTYLQWMCGGHVRVTVTSTAGANGIVSAVFFG